MPLLLESQLVDWLCSSLDQTDCVSSFRISVLARASSSVTDRPISALSEAIVEAFFEASRASYTIRR